MINNHTYPSWICQFINDQWTLDEWVVHAGMPPGEYIAHLVTCDVTSDQVTIVPGIQMYFYFVDEVKTKQIAFVTRNCAISSIIYIFIFGWCGIITLSDTHIMPVLVLLSVVGVGMQQCMIQNQNEMHKLKNSSQEWMQICSLGLQYTALGHFSLTKFFPWLFVKSLTYHWQLSKSLTFPGFPEKWSACISCRWKAS